MDLYTKALMQLVSEGKLDPHASTLIIAGGSTDRQRVLDAGFTDVTISNLDTRMVGTEFAPYKWQFIDGENIDLPDDSFDQVIEHMGVHHCASPHRAVLEMYRVAKNSVLFMENRDSWVMKLGQTIGFVPSFEFAAVISNGHQFGGYRNTGIPNYVYRWTENEIIKMISTADPSHRVPIRFFYHLRFPNSYRRAASGHKRIVLELAALLFPLFTFLFKRQCNEFGAFIEKNARQNRSWIDIDTGVLRRDFVFNIVKFSPPHETTVN